MEKNQKFHHSSNQDCAEIIHGRKRQKIQTHLNNQEHYSDGIKNNTEGSIKLFCNCFTSSEIKTIKTAVQGIKNYPKIVAVHIRHQEKSLKTLSPEILLKLGELKQRVGDCVLRAKMNMILLEDIIKDWKNVIDYEANINNHHCQQHHEHNHCQHHEDKISPNQILNVLHHLCRQWSDIGQNSRRPMKIINQLLRKYCVISTEKLLKKEFLGKVMVQGASMGRIIYEINNMFSLDSIQSYEDRILYFLCGQYMLYSCKQNKMMYPFITQFSNNYNERRPYTPVIIPDVNISTLKEENESQGPKIYTNFGNYVQKSTSNKYNEQYDLFLSYFVTDRIVNVLQWIQIVYKNLKQGGIWINVCYSNFENALLPMCYQQFKDIIIKTQFTLVQQFKRPKMEMNISKGELDNEQFDKLESMLSQFTDVYFIILKK